MKDTDWKAALFVGFLLGCLYVTLLVILEVVV